MRWRGVWIAFFCLGLIGDVTAQVLPQPQGELSFDTPITGTVASQQAHLYTVTVPTNTFITLELEARNIYMLLLDQQEQIMQPQAQTAADILGRFVYFTGQAEAYTLWLEGAGAYTITLKNGDQLRETQTSLALGDTAEGQLDIDQTYLYELNTPDNSLIALTLAQPRALIAAEIRDDTGMVISPVLTRSIDRDTATFIYNLSEHSPYILGLRGSGRYSVTLADGKTLAGQPENVKSGETVSAEAPLTGIVPYRFTTDASHISIAIQASNVQLTLADANQQRIFARTSYFDDTAQSRVFVFPLASSPAPYTLHMFITTRYSLLLTEGDTSERDMGILQGNTVTARTLEPGLTPRYTLDTERDTPLIFNLFYNALALTAPLEVIVMSSDNVMTRAEMMIPVASNQVRFTLRPQGEPPYTLAPGITGTHMLSIVADTPSDGVRIQLIEDEVNLRGGSTITDPILRVGKLNEEMIAIQQSADERWLLALTEDNLVVWVFRSLVRPVRERDSLSDLPILTPSPTATFTPTATATVTATAVSTLTSEPQTTPETTQEAPDVVTTTAPGTTNSGVSICEIESEGGVNLRRGPGTNQPVIGSLTQGTKLGVIGQYTDREDNIWWQLVTEAWVRADVVLETGACNEVPVIRIN